MNIREIAFWVVDFAKGGGIRRDYIDINRVCSSPSIEVDNEVISNLLKHSIATVPYYHTCKFDINTFPVVNKNIIREQWDSFVSDKFDKSTLKVVTTSGSTGTPFPVYMDKRKLSRNSADVIFFSKFAGYNFGMPIIYMKIWVKSRMQSGLVYRLRNFYPIDVLNYSDKDSKFVLKRAKSGNVSILAYASVLDNLSKYMTDNDIAIKRGGYRAMIAMSESLSEHTKANLTARCGVNVVSRYSNLECGIMAQQPADGSAHFFINRASYYIEILKVDSDAPAEIGELGRIVVTDLYNYAQPMIRYDTGDVGAFEDEQKRYISTIEGRRLDLLYNTKGQLISSYIVYKNMWQYREIEQYQLIQEGEKDYKLKISPKNGFKKEEQIVSEFVSYLGDDAKIIIEYVDQIPLLASGKRKKIVNNYKK
ncbi:Coenzyme F390 synthetase [Mucinivorans hirudinis]|uniref:Coenzyme F390 synthetase n=1 Tax=Mucinivorans hirudinis TaxID=1433126 RepID=A0A060R6V8_9BACT|nr:Coenzyme F390 synthetase [Mucinivorans hirudinis]